MTPGPTTGDGEPFTWHDHSGRTVVASAEQVEQLNRRGYFVMTDVFHPDTVDDILDAVAASPVNAPTLDSTQCDALRNVCTHPLLAGLARDFVGPDACVHSDRLVVRPPHERDLRTFHRDVLSDQIGPMQFITCWVALTNATLANGCLSILRGGHRSDALPGVTTEVTEVEVRAGSVVVLSTLTPRRALPNTTDRPAMAYVINYIGEPYIVLDGSPLAVVRGGQLVGPS